MTKTEFFKQAWRWSAGRQGTGYEKCLLLTGYWPRPFDCYLLRYRKGQGIPPHTDPVANGRHFRLNIVLRKSRGGEFQCKDPLFTWRRVFLFRSDLSIHAVSPVESGTRYVLSIGWVMPPLSSVA